MKKKQDLNGYNFKDYDTRKRMKYLVIRQGDLDLNNAYAFFSRKDLDLYVKDSSRDIYAVFKIKDITNPF